MKTYIHISFPIWLRIRIKPAILAYYLYYWQPLSKAHIYLSLETTP